MGTTLSRTASILSAMSALITLVQGQSSSMYDMSSFMSASGFVSARYTLDMNMDTA